MDLLHFISSHPLELVTVVVSLIWLYLEYRASIWLWPVGILLPLLWIPICWQSRLYGMLAINIYYLVTSIIGWVVWLQKRGDEAEEKPITDISPRTALVYALGAIGVSGSQRASEERLKALVEDLKKRSDLPVAVGFGVKNKNDADEVKTYADGAIIGTEIVKLTAKFEGEELIKQINKLF